LHSRLSSDTLNTLCSLTLTHIPALSTDASNTLPAPGGAYGIDTSPPIPSAHMNYFATLTHDALDDAVSQQYLAGKTLTTTMVARCASLLNRRSRTALGSRLNYTLPDAVVEALLTGQDGCPEEAHLPLARETIKMLHGCLWFRFRDFSRWPKVFQCAEAIFSCFATLLVCAMKPPPLSLSCKNVFSERGVWRGGRGSSQYIYDRKQIIRSKANLQA
jgi:hypothetical protein